MAMGCMKVGKSLGWLYSNNITRVCYFLCHPATITTTTRNNPHNSSSMMAMKSKEKEELWFTFEEREREREKAEDKKADAQVDTTTSTSTTSNSSTSSESEMDGHTFYWAPLPSRRAVFSPISRSGAGGPPPYSRHFNSHFHSK